MANMIMLTHHGFRALWSVIFFLPWLLLGSVYLSGCAIRHLRRQASICSRHAPQPQITRPRNWPKPSSSFFM